MPAPLIRPQEIVLIRQRLDLTQEELAERVGVQRTSVCHWEAGIRSPGGPARIMLDRLRQAAAKQAEK
jgi:DNA-binding transcriptional regulator YiaG